MGCESIQIFNQSPRMWRPTRYSDDDFAGFREAMGDSKVQVVAIHAIYLINPATKDSEMRKKSLNSLVHALRVGDGIGAMGVVIHPGALKDDTRTNARKRAVKLIKEALAETDRCPILYENTAGSPQLLGRDFDETAELIDKTGGPKRLGLCIDSCHLHATGYDVRTPEGMKELVDEIDAKIGLEAAEAPPRQRLARSPRLEPRPARSDPKRGDRPAGHARLPRRAAPPGAARGPRRPGRGREGRGAQGHADNSSPTPPSNRGEKKWSVTTRSRQC